MLPIAGPPGPNNRSLPGKEISKAAPTGAGTVAATTSRSDRPLNLEAVVNQVTETFVHRLFPSYRDPSFLACPDDEIAAITLNALTRAAESKGVTSEIIDLRPAPADLLNGVTARLRDFDVSRRGVAPHCRRLLVLEGFDRLEGRNRDEPTYQFRSKFQFDVQHLWLFVGRDWRRLSRMFHDRRLLLYHAASDVTPEHWRNQSGPRDRAR